MNEQYAKDIATKVKSAFKTKQRNGDFIGAFASYGYRKDTQNRHKLVIDEYASNIIKRIFTMFADGKGKLTIAKILNKEGVLCPTEYKTANGLAYNNGNKLEATKYWTYATIHRILINQMYIGNMVQGKSYRENLHAKAKTTNKSDWIIVENTHPPIIDADLWDKAQDLAGRDTRTIDFEQNVSVFAGFLKCADCGRAMAKTDRKGIIDYVCGTYKRYGTDLCGSHRIKHTALESVLLGEINFLLSKTADIENIIDETGKNLNEPKRNNKAEIQKLNDELEKIFRLKKAVYEDYKLDEIGEREYKAYKSDYVKQETNIKQKLELLENEENRDIYNILNDKWIKNLRKYKRVEKLDRNILSEFIDNIIIHNSNEIEIVYKFNGIAEWLKEKKGA
jgi:hypothetical protein